MNDILVSKEQVKRAFYTSTERFHIIACWVGIFLNLVWGISDYFVFPSYFLNFLLFRISVSILAIFLVLFRKIVKIDIYTCMFVLVLGISIQNAFMWSVMDLENLKQHTFAFMVLFIGSGMLVLWEPKYSYLLIFGTIGSIIFFYGINSTIPLKDFIISGALLVITVAIFSVFLIRTRYRMTYSEIKSRLELAKSKEIIERENEVVLRQSAEISNQKEVLEHRNQEITDSITYALRIQEALIPNEKELCNLFDDGFVYFKPKDIVSGDFFWYKKIGELVYYATADCTGHGVPGGFMTVLCMSYLDELVKENEEITPGEILDLVRNKIVSTLSHGKSGEETKDGMDLVLCCINLSTKFLQFSSANNSLYILRNNKLMKYDGDKQPCGFYIESKPFSTSEIDLELGDKIYTFTDGLIDQFGGINGKKFRRKQLEELILKNHESSFSNQKNCIENSMGEWMKNEEQTDDMLLIGVKI